MPVCLARRTLLAAGTAALVLGQQPRLAHAAVALPTMRRVADEFLATIPEAERDRVMFPFGGRVHHGWNFMGTSVKPGMPLEHMTAAQKSAADVLLRAGLSQSGYDKTRLIMATQDVMRALGDGPADRNSERFSVALFDQPAADRLWGWRIEGHHLSLSWTLLGDELVAVTPAAFSVIPQNIPVGDLRGRVVLEQEEDLARRLLRDLTGTRRERAVFTGNKPRNVMAQAGREGRFTERAGLAVADMAAAQRELLWQLLTVTAVAPWPAPMAEAQAVRIRAGDAEAAHFAWAGSAEPGGMYYYRLHGDTFVIEFTNVFGDPQHIHAVYHDVERTLGRHVRS